MKLKIQVNTSSFEGEPTIPVTVVVPPTPEEIEAALEAAKPLLKKGILSFSFESGDQRAAIDDARMASDILRRIAEGLEKKEVK